MTHAALNQTQAELPESLLNVHLERRGVIDVRKRFIRRNRDAQERAERLPPLLDVKDQQTIWSNRLSHRLIVLGKDALAMLAIGETVVERAGKDDIPRHLG